MKKGWALLPLGEVCTLEKAQGRHEGLPYVGLEHIESATGRFVGQTTPVTVKSSTFRFDEHHVLYGRLRPYLNKVLVPTFAGHCSTEIFPLRPKDQVLNRHFLAYWLMADRTVRALNATSTGARMPRANATQMMCFQIPVPPLAEQERIVRILDDALARVKAARRASQAALEIAAQIHFRRLQEVFGDLARAWPTEELSAVAEVQSGGTPRASKADYWGGDIAWFSSGELGEDFVGATQRCITTLGLAESNAKVFPAGSLLIGMYDTAALKMSVLTEPAAFNQAIAGVKPSTRLDTYFAMLAIASRKPEILAQRRGVRQRNLSLQKVKSIAIPLPPMDIQKTVVAEFRALRSDTRELGSVEDNRITLLDELRESILDQALSGNCDSQAALPIREATH